MKHEDLFRIVVRGLLSIGIPPTPTRINRFLGRLNRNRINHINGREARWRADELRYAGWQHETSPFGRITWRPPQ